MLLTGQEYKDVLLRYVNAKLGAGTQDFGNCIVIGYANNDAEIVAGAVFNNFSHPNICMHIAADWMVPQFIAAIMRYPFIQLGCARVTGMIEKRNWQSRRFAAHLGARLEGVMKKASKNGDICIYGLMRESAEKWLTPRYQARLEPFRKAA